MIDFRRGRPGGLQPQHFLLEALLPKLGQGQHVPQSVDAPAGVLVAPIYAASYAHRLGNAFFFPDAGLFLDPTPRGGSGSTEYHAFIKTFSPINVLARFAFRGDAGLPGGPQRLHHGAGNGQILGVVGSGRLFLD